MHIQTHIMSGWCVANLFSLSARQRAVAMVAASVPDLDGLGIFASDELYWDFHHKVCHNIFLGILMAAILTWLAKGKLKVFVLFLGLFHLHLLMDFFGSGEGWGVYYLWPVSNHFTVTNYAWPFYSWQNLSTAGLLLVWIVFILLRYDRTPLEGVMPSLDRQLIGLVAKGREWATRRLSCNERQ